MSTWDVTGICVMVMGITATQSRGGADHAEVGVPGDPGQLQPDVYKRQSALRVEWPFACRPDVAQRQSSGLLIHWLKVQILPSGHPRTLALQGFFAFGELAGCRP